jgi:putative heme-binding domain-containing protein
VKEITPEEYFAFALRTRGDLRRGRVLFEDQKGVACIKCHAAGGAAGGDLGPNLASIGVQYGREHLAESILDPSKVVRDGYRQEIVVLRTGDLLAGAVKAEGPEGLVLQTADGEKRSLARSSIRERTASALSLMPEGLQAGLTLEEFADLVEYLASLRGPRRAGE